ncbi:MAG: SMP-30/gluconolactonase/LRE family protein [Prosthecobacter sp.]|uniref:SMP-30/gluconolactonase/LRE family protein n=1 Tax=Prosthecobacter sp. TaxID=1965333 RepID=UPI0038FD9761
MKPAALLAFLALNSVIWAADPFFAAGAKVEKLFTGHGETEGCTTAPDGTIYFSDITLSRIVKDAKGVMQGGHIWRFDPKTGQTTLFRSPSAKSNGLEFDPAGNLVACEGADFGGRRISRTDMQTGLCSILTATFEGRPFNAPNDLAIARDGRIFFTDPKYVGPEPVEQPVMAVYRIDTTNKVTRLITDAGKPNGVCLSPDERTLYVGVNDNGSEGVDALLNDQHEPPPLRKGLMAILAYDLNSDGSAACRSIFVNFGSNPGPDGIVCDAQGNVWAAARNPARSGILVFSPEGKELAYLKVESPPTNLCFGKGDDRHLYITAGSSLWRVGLK